MKLFGPAGSAEFPLLLGHRFVGGELSHASASATISAWEQHSELAPRHRHPYFGCTACSQETRAALIPDSWRKLLPGEPNVQQEPSPATCLHQRTLKHKDMSNATERKQQSFRGDGRKKDISRLSWDENHLAANPGGSLPDCSDQAATRGRVDSQKGRSNDHPPALITLQGVSPPCRTSWSSAPLRGPAKSACFS